ncbi:LPXTG cell wall anchor domain-containing protein [Glycomyces sp. NPDC047010]|uniref:LPXTG cell wall anchor domain-containing protein n=1 Tax=Glycomyces sp. NPDC047010 TaxID=3155023 RepID=UPI0033E80574
MGDEAEYVYSFSDHGFPSVEPGGTIELVPTIYQHTAFSDYAAAAVVAFSGAEVDVEFAAPDAIADFDNCMESFRGVTCLITDIENSPGTVFGLTDPITLALDEQFPGPFNLCGCDYRVYVINDDTFEEEFGGVFWDEDSDNLIGMVPVDAPPPYEGTGVVTFRTAENHFDLSVADTEAAGPEGERVTVTVPVANAGTAAAVPFFDPPGSYVVTGDLPDGLRLHAVEGGDAATCPDDWADRLDGIDTEGLDFACFFQSLRAGDQLELEVAVDITDADSTDVGRLEVLALGDRYYPGDFEADPSDNVADFTVDGHGGHGQLPNTGASLGLVIAVAAVVVVAGAVLLVVTARRRRSGAE